ncbi:hypothetical protein EFM09_04540 [Latilactobacillus curvatus]|uniref:hypothetical protein n=1 Tax=Latilactobacillus curvatus TaxID=28038 RepID=UPI000978B12B|nr:hypothetical protein [Latilactobacillus curvatus]MCT1215818.1 hypothetical protein [Latilactobacillus curvatus]UTC14153.1 hypothetical protein A4W80_04110 [Latilactobacillus curvatus]WHQ77603.1 hypothetical protein QFC96_06810 [Latilactobacillus curvatus]
MKQFEPARINDQYSLTLSQTGNVELHKEGIGVVGSMSYYYTRNDLPLFICRHEPTADLRTIHEVMVQFDQQMDEMVECGCLIVGGQNVAIKQTKTV